MRVGRVEALGRRQQGRERVKRVVGNGTGRGAGYSTTCMHLLLLF